jgi:hypothetical protein
MLTSFCLTLVDEVYTTTVHTSASSLRDLGKMSKNTATRGNTHLTGDISDFG